MKTFLRISRRYLASTGPILHRLTTKAQLRKHFYIELEWAIYKAELNK